MRARVELFMHCQPKLKLNSRSSTWFEVGPTFVDIAFLILLWIMDTFKLRPSRRTSWPYQVGVFMGQVG